MENTQNNLINYALQRGYYKLLEFLEDYTLTPAAESPPAFNKSKYKKWANEHHIYWCMIQGKIRYTEITYFKIKKTLEAEGYTELITELNRHRHTIISTYELITTTDDREFYALTCVESYLKIHGQMKIKSEREYIMICRELSRYKLPDLQGQLNRVYPPARFIRYQAFVTINKKLKPYWRKQKMLKIFKLFQKQKTIDELWQESKRFLSPDCIDFVENLEQWANTQPDREHILKNFYVITRRLACMGESHTRAVLLFARATKLHQNRFEKRLNEALAYTGASFKRFFYFFIQCFLNKLI